MNTFEDEVLELLVEEAEVEEPTKAMPCIPPQITNIHVAPCHSPAINIVVKLFKYEVDFKIYLKSLLQTDSSLHFHK